MRAPATFLSLGLLLAGAPLYAGPAKDEFVQIIQASVELPEESYLDVGIEVLNPGLDGRDPSKQEEKGVFEDVRKSESRFIPFHLADTLQSTGHWGAVRVIPAGFDSLDVLVTGHILVSNGRELKLRMVASDASGRRWFDRNYRQIAAAGDYQSDASLQAEPYQSLYNRFANDLLKARGRLKPEDVAEIRTLSGLRFAADLAPTPFEDYVAANKKGRWKAKRLPAEDDPMMARIADVRERDYMFIDGLNEYYANFYARMEPSYDEWRSFSYDEQMALRKIRRQARLSKILGAVAIVGSAIAPGASYAAQAGRTAAAVAGTMLLSNGMAQGSEVKMHVEAIRELAASFEIEVAPMLVEVDGQTLKLSGSAEAQYREWRDLLRELFAVETGLEVDADSSHSIAEAADGR